MTAKDVSIDARDWVLLGLLSVLWGGSFFFNGVVLKELPPFTLVLLRVALAALMLLPLMLNVCPAFRPLKAVSSSPTRDTAPPICQMG